MRYKVEISVMIAVLFVLSLAGVASADSVTKTLYVDGALVGTSTTTQALSFPYPRLTIGSEGNRWYRYSGLVGEIDEFAVYGGILTDTDVAAHFSAGAGGYVAAVTASNPLLYLRFEDASSSEGSKAANNGSLADVNSTYIGAVGLNASGYVGKSAIFHGATGGTGDCVDVCDYPTTLSLVDISVEFWVKTTQNTEYPRFFQHNGAHTEEHSYGAMYAAGTNAVGLIGGGDTGYITSVINDGSWHHIVVTFNSIQPGPYATEVMADDPCVYLKFDNIMPVDSSENDWYVGKNSAAFLKYAPGGIGNAVYLDTRILVGDTPHQDAAMYTWNNYGGTYEREGPQFALFDDLYAFAASDISFELWFKNDPVLVPTLSRYAMLFQQIGAYTKEPNAPGVGIDGNVPGASVMRVLAGSQWWWPGVDTPLDGQWHHLVVTYDENEVNPGRDMGVEFYLDGELRNSVTIVDDVNFEAKLGPELCTIMIGSMNDRGWPYNCWGGYIDEFAIYAGILSADRVAAHYAAWQPKDCADVKARGLTLAGDFNDDCKVDLYDFVVLSVEWRLCNTPGVSGCGQTW